MKQAFMNVLAKFGYDMLKFIFLVHVMESWGLINKDFYDIDWHSLANLGEINFSIALPLSVLNRKNEEGWTPLMYASSKGCHTIVNYFLRLGASTDCTDKFQRSCLMLAIGSGDLETVKSLCILNQEDIDQVDSRGWTALFYAVWFHREVCTKFLLERGANPHIRDFEGETPQSLAIKLEIEPVMELFKNNWPPTNNNVEGTPKERVLNKIQPKLLKPPHKSIIGTRLLKLNTFSPNKHLRTSHPFKGKENTSPGDRKILSPSTLPSVSANCEPYYRLPTAMLSPQVTRLPKPKSQDQQIVISNKRLQLDSPRQAAEATIMPVKREGPTEQKQTKFSSDMNSVQTTQSDTIDTENVKKETPYSPLECTTMQSFLIQLNLEKYWSVFKDEEVDFETLLTFDETNLLDIGIRAYGPRRKILAAVQEYRQINGEPRPLLKDFSWRK